MALVTVVLVVHFAYLVYVVLGGFLAWRWPKAIVPHLAAGAWGFVVVVFQLRCPLTTLENWARVRAGRASQSEGFIDRYIEGVLYPERYTVLLDVLVGFVVIVSWIGAYRRWKRRADTPSNADDSREPAATV
jgi:hypothetical protein